ncbi:DUF354 domain-containing protein [Haladaptatus sp. DJG-WS-42]|uniref:DUF354 domain-containing protein n=1 Tax=Haladaptatus sp. DJG-WS-42 TaxID=3120516 RepID=UPI0030D352BF
MRVMVTIQHPAHVHFFRHAIAELEDDGHEVHVFARDKEMALDLLSRFDIDHEVLAGTGSGLSQLARVQAVYEARLLNRARDIEPDVITAIGGVAAAHVSRLVGAKSLVFYDTEHATIIKGLAYPFAHRIATPDCYRDTIGPHQRRYPSYHELAYLHPDRFEVDESKVPEVAETDDKLVVLRLIEWGASHDMGKGGFDDVEEVVSRLEAAGAEVVITAEGDFPDALAAKQISVAPHEIHHLLGAADLFIGEGATMAAESAVLGTPAVYVNSLTMGYTDELDEAYGLLFNCNGENRHEQALETAVSLLEGDTDWAAKRESLLADKVDTTDVIREQLREVTA